MGTETALKSEPRNRMRQITVAACELQAMSLPVPTEDFLHLYPTTAPANCRNAPLIQQPQCTKRRLPGPARRWHWFSHSRRSNVWHYGIGGLGTGETPQTADAQGGRGGVGISNSLPWVAAEPPLIQEPVKVSMLG